MRVADFTVCNNIGTVLCKFEGMELHKHSSASYTVKTRFDLLPQPVIVNAALPEYRHRWQRPDKEEIDALGTVVDHISVDIIKKSLTDDLVVGEEVGFVPCGESSRMLMDCVLQMHRQRYLAFAKSAVQWTLPPLPPQSVIEQLKLKFPANFELLRRMSLVHKDVFKTSAVRFDLSVVRFVLGS
jgi:hypothetical protein